MTSSLVPGLHQLLHALPAGRRYAENFAAKIIAHYEEPHRHYHTLTHIENLIALIDEYRDHIRFPEVLTLVAWYHDVVYDPTSSDNEDRSADFATEQLHQLGAESALIRRINNLILLTKSHTLQNEDDTDAAFFLDIDLSVLGAEPETYRRYVAQIRNEFSRYPDLLYKPGRRKVLRHFLEQPQIYRTDFLREMWEEQARRNMEEELKTLS